MADIVFLVIDLFAGGSILAWAGVTGGGRLFADSVDDRTEIVEAGHIVNEVGIAPNNLEKLTLSHPTSNADCDSLDLFLFCIAVSGSHVGIVLPVSEDHHDVIHIAPVPSVGGEPVIDCVVHSVCDIGPSTVVGHPCNLRFETGSSGVGVEIDVAPGVAVEFNDSNSNSRKGHFVNEI
jgi:hypothetical protein